MSPRLATFLVFAVNGAMVGTWVAHIPWLQDHLAVSKATLGLCLLCMAAGALVSMPLTGRILDRRSSGSVTRAATLVFCLMLPLPLLATSPAMLAGILFVFGATGGAMDVSMNAHGVAVERTLTKSSNQDDARCRGAMGACDARTQGAPIVPSIGATEDAAARVHSAARRHSRHSDSSSKAKPLPPRGRRRREPRRRAPPP